MKYKYFKQALLFKVGSNINFRNVRYQKTNIYIIYLAVYQCVTFIQVNSIVDVVAF